MNVVGKNKSNEAEDKRNVLLNQYNNKIQMVEK